MTFKSDSYIFEDMNFNNYGPYIPLPVEMRVQHYEPRRELSGGNQVVPTGDARFFVIEIPSSMGISPLKFERTFDFPSPWFVEFHEDRDESRYRAIDLCTYDVRSCVSIMSRSIFRTFDRVFCAMGIYHTYEGRIRFSKISKSKDTHHGDNETLQSFPKPDFSTEASEPKMGSQYYRDKSMLYWFLQESKEVVDSFKSFFEKEVAPELPLVSQTEEISEDVEKPKNVEISIITNNSGTMRREENFKKILEENFPSEILKKSFFVGTSTRPIVDWAKKLERQKISKLKKLEHHELKKANEDLCILEQELFQGEKRYQKKLDDICNKKERNSLAHKCCLDRIKHESCRLSKVLLGISIKSRKMIKNEHSQKRSQIREDLENVPFEYGRESAKGSKKRKERSASVHIILKAEGKCVVEFLTHDDRETESMKYRKFETDAGVKYNMMGERMNRGMRYLGGKNDEVSNRVIEISKDVQAMKNDIFGIKSQMNEMESSIKSIMETVNMMSKKFSGMETKN